MKPPSDNWFADESFWETTFPFMFPESRFTEAENNVAKIAALSGVTAGKVLDLACGPGRFAVPLALAGYAVTGVDRSRFLLNKARQLAERRPALVEWVEQDVRSFSRPDAFDLVLNLFTSFGYFTEAADNELVLRNIFASLKPGGVFVFDHLGKEILASRFRPTNSESLPDGSLLIQRISAIDDWSRIAAEWIVIRDDLIHRFENCHWVYSGQEFRGLLTKAGFVDIELCGSLDKTAYGPQAERLVAVARKPA